MDRKRILFASITALGVSSVITQIVLMREFLSIFSGNELVFGIILANWLLLTGTGSYLGRWADRVKDKMGLLAVSQVGIAVLPVVHIILIRGLRNTVFTPGAMVDVTQIVAFSFFLLLPYCLISGFFLPMAAVVFSPKRDAAQIGQVYFIDNIGDILGGALFSFILVYILDPFQMVFFIMVINLGAAFLVASFAGTPGVRPGAIVLFLISAPFFTLFDLNDATIRPLYPGQDLIHHESTPYGTIVVTESQGQFNFYENGVPLFSTMNVIAAEETVHYPMLQHPEPKEVLLISGGISGTLEEILKYGVERVDYVELDPGIIQVGRLYASLPDDERVNLITADGRGHVKTTTERYDVVIIDLPDPSSAQVNRFYTQEFYQEVKGVLNQDGVVSISLSAPANYITPEVRRLNSALYNAMKISFTNIIIIPGSENFFLASDGPLDHDISYLSRQRGIKGQYVNAYYLRGKLTQERITYVMQSIDEPVRPNRDLEPVSYYYHLSYWTSHFALNYTAFIGLIGIVFVVYLTRLRPVTFSIFTTGFAGAGLEVVLLIGFQVLYGYVYHMVGIIITAFMVGLAIGAHGANRWFERIGKREFVAIELGVASFSFLVPGALILLGKTGTFAPLVIPILSLLLACLVGAQFPLASKLSFAGVAETASDLYNADLVGAAFGALLVSALLIPILGIVKVCLLIGGLNLVSGMVMGVRG